jgi:hypothetical protein
MLCTRISCGLLLIQLRLGLLQVFKPCEKRCDFVRARRKAHSVGVGRQVLPLEVEQGSRLPRQLSRDSHAACGDIQPLG